MASAIDPSKPVTGNPTTQSVRDNFAAAAAEISALQATIASSQGDITAVIAGTGLLGGGASGDVTLSLDPTALGDITSVAAGTGLTGGGNSGDVSLALQVPVTIANGGTGAGTAAAALNNLGAAPLDNPTFTGTVTIPSGANITGYLPTAGGVLASPGNLTVRGGILGGAAGTVPAAGAMLLNANAVAPPAAPVGGVASQLYVVGADGAAPQIGMDAFANTVGGTLLEARRARGTAAAPAALQNGDSLLYISGLGRGATSYNNSSGASINFQTSQAWTDTAQGTLLNFFTTPNGSATQVNSLVLAGTNATFSGTVNVTSSSGNAQLNLNYPAGSGGNLAGTKAGSNRWVLSLGNGTAESGGNSGNDFAVWRYDDSGNWINTAFLIARATGNATFAGAVSLPTGQAIYLNGTTTGTAGRLACDANNFYLGLPGTGVFLVANAASTTTLLSIDANGNLTIFGANAQKASGTTWANPSSRDIKNDIQPYDKGLQAVLALKPSTYRFQRGLGLPEGRHIGLVHDETKHMPEMHTKAVIGGTHDTPGREVDALDCSAITFALINAVRELTQRLEAVEKRGAK